MKKLIVLLVTILSLSFISCNDEIEKVSRYTSLEPAYVEDLIYLNQNKDDFLLIVYEPMYKSAHKEDNQWHIYYTYNDGEVVFCNNEIVSIEIPELNVHEVLTE